MLDPAGRPVVMDFGLALRSTAADDLRLTLTGVAMGTPAYMPPEQAGGDTEAIGPPADVYALGVVLYELVTGRVPFKGKSFGQLLAQIERDAPPPPSSFNENIEPALEAIILTCLAKRPADRFASAGELADALDRYFDGDDRALLAEYHRPYEVPGPTGEFVPAASGSVAVPRLSRRGLWAAVAAGLLLVGAAAGAVIYVQTDHGELEIRLSDPTARVDVKVNGKEVALDSAGRVTRIKAGKNQKLEVSGPDYETVAESFDLKRGGVTIVQVRLKKPEVAQKPDPKSNTGKKAAGPDPPVPAVPPKPKPPPPYPKESTLIEVPGWQILADATKEKMDAWLADRKKANHSVMWLDVYPLGDKPVYSAVAALDDRESKWVALTAMSQEEMMNNEPQKYADFDSYYVKSIGGFVRDSDLFSASLWHPGRKQWTYLTAESTAAVSQLIELRAKRGNIQLMRPFPKSAGALRWALYVELNSGESAQTAHGQTAEELTRYLESQRAEGRFVTSLAAAVDAQEPTFAAVTKKNATNAEWDAEWGLTVEKLAEAARLKRAKGFHPTCVTAYPWDGAVRYCAVWVKEPPKPVPYPKEPTLIEADGWQILADATKDEMQKWLDARKKDKHSVMWLDATAVDGQPLFCAVAALDDRASGWQATLGMPSEPFPAELAKRFATKDARLVSIAGYVQNESIQIALLAHPKYSGWAAFPDAPREYLPEVEARIEKNGHGYRVFRPYPAFRGTVAFAMITEPMAAGGERRFDLTQDELTKFGATVRAAGDRLTSLCAYPAGGRLVFAATTGTNAAKAEWSADVNLSAGQLKAKTEEQTKKGFRPDCVTVCAWDGAVRYCVVWTKEPPKKP